MLLALDTSNDYAGIAVWDRAGLRGEANWFAGRHHTEQLLPQVDLLLRHLDVGPGGLQVVAVATGPGSWSGLRAGMSLAKALAVGRGLALVGVATLDALGYSQCDRGAPVVALIRLGRDRYAMARYTGPRSSWRREGDFRTVSGSEAPDLARGALLVGDLPPSIAVDQDGGARVAGVTEHQRRAAFVAELAWERHMRDDHDDLVALEPVYLGSPVREAGQGSSER